MFQRRLKVLLAIICGIAAVLVARALILQVVQGDYWRQQAARTMRRSQLVDAPRGSILDYKGRPLAVDEPCFDAAVDYRAIVRDPDWLREQAQQRLRDRPDSGWDKANKAARAKLVEQELLAVDHDLDAMWRTLAAVSGKMAEEMEGIRADIRQRVEMRQRYVWYMRYAEAVTQQRNRSRAPWYKEWIISGEATPQLDSFNVTVAEQLTPHVILHNIDVDAYNLLEKNKQQFPGLVLQRSTYRHYPYADVACHVLGYMGKAMREDLASDPNFDDELLSYEPNDQIGRSGLESLCEPALRGRRGRIERDSEKEQVLSRVEPVPGKDVRTTIDIELQKRIQQAFAHVEWRSRTGEVIEAHEMHGAVVVIDVASGEVRALVSYPTYDVNKFDGLYAAMAADDINQPLLNRATQSRREPGSTAKVMVGLAAVNEGVFKTEETIECTGFLVLDGHKYTVGRCWVESEFGTLLRAEHMSAAHHQVPYEDPHPTGFLTLTDAVQRSCDPFFETLGDRLGWERLAEWYGRFGMGRPTGLGIAEARGTTPADWHIPAEQRRAATWFASMGQGTLLATPIQMGNVAATIARDGVSVRPRLVVDPADAGRPATRPVGPDVVDMHLPPAALKAVQEGMDKVVSTPGGTAHRGIYRKDLPVAGKTGTAQAARFNYPLRDPETGKIVLRDGRPVRVFPTTSTREQPNPLVPWYRGSGGSGRDLAHGWFIGYAPAKSPQIAIAVMLEYGGSGGGDAAPVVNAVLDACIKEGYLATEHP